jgi:predicted MFS family arabinose efflux permease
VRLAERLPNLESDQFGFILAAGGVGMAIGAGFLGNWGQRLSRRQLGLWGSFGMATSLVGLAVFTTDLTLSLAVTTFLGFFGALVGIPMQTTIQEETPESKRGKVFGLQNNAVNIALSLPLALASIAETIFGLEAVLLGLAGSAIIGGILTWYISQSGDKN